MPWGLVEGPKGQWSVVTKGTGKKHSKKPMSHAKAVAQLRALYANAKPGER